MVLYGKKPSEKRATSIKEWDASFFKEDYLVIDVENNTYSPETYFIEIKIKDGRRIFSRRKLVGME